MESELEDVVETQGGHCSWEAEMSTMQETEGRKLLEERIMGVFDDGAPAS
jgi:hypothetical protein